MKQGKEALEALQELLERIAKDPDAQVKVMGLNIGSAGAEHHPLQAVFDRCIEQVTSGKGDERHGYGRGFYDQPWVELAQTHGVGFLTGQSEKKLKEAQSMDLDAWEREMLGAIVYAAMAILYRFAVENKGACAGNCAGGGNEH